MKILIGIDTGVKTGYAVAHDLGSGGKLEEVQTLSITQAMDRVKQLAERYGKENMKLYIEDARKRTFVTGGREKLQGVGSVKRDALIWEDWCKEQEFHYLMVHPKANTTKLKVDQFKKRTGWTKRTSEHARDAAMLVVGRFFKI